MTVDPRHSIAAAALIASLGVSTAAHAGDPICEISSGHKVCVDIARTAEVYRVPFTLDGGSGVLVVNCRGGMWTHIFGNREFDWAEIHSGSIPDSICVAFRP